MLKSERDGWVAAEVFEEEKLQSNDQNYLIPTPSSPHCQVW